MIPTNPVLTNIVADGLPAFQRTIRGAVHTLESAFACGNLPDALCDLERARLLTPDLTGVYKRLLEQSPDSLGCSPQFRGALVPAICKDAELLLEDPAFVFHAEPELFEVLEEGADAPTVRLRSLTADSTTGAVELRLSRALTVRYWGIGFALADPDASRLMDVAVARMAANRLASDIGNILRVARWFSTKDLASRPLRMAGREVGRNFEQLMLDLLNEHQDCARRASLFEDLVEKTDLRVSVEAKRRHGARVQVTQVSDEWELARKQATMSKKDEIVLLTPATLGIALSTSSKIGCDETTEARRALAGVPPASPTAHAAELKRIFLEAIRGAGLHPLGPIAQVPGPIRAFVRAHVAREATRTTDRLRERENQEGRLDLKPSWVE